MADNNATTPVPPPAAAGAESPVEKSKNADKNEAKRLAKMEKFLAKQKVLNVHPHSKLWCCMHLQVFLVTYGNVIITGLFGCDIYRLLLKRPRLPPLPTRRRRRRPSP